MRNLRVAAERVPYTIAVLSASTAASTGRSTATTRRGTSAAGRRGDIGVAVDLVGMSATFESNTRGTTHRQAIGAAAELVRVAGTSHVAITDSSLSATIIELITAIALGGIFHSCDRISGCLACCGATLDAHTASYGNAMRQGTSADRIAGKTISAAVHTQRL